MQPRRLLRCKAQPRWLQPHPALRQDRGLAEVPHRITLSRRSTGLSPLLPDCLALRGQDAEALDPHCTRQDLSPEQRLGKAQGPVWQQSARQAGRSPAKLRQLDTEASGSQSGSPGWVEGEGRPLVDHRGGLPPWGQMATAAGAERDVIEPPAPPLSQPFRPATVTTDHSDAKARRLRQWAQQGVVRLRPAGQGGKGRYAWAYPR